MLYKGYIEIKNKKALEKYKNRKDLRTLKEVQSLNGYAGVLADETIMIDIDDTIQSDILARIIVEKKIKCRIVKTTRGRHFLFKNTNVKHCGNDKNLAIGLHADIKIGTVASYEVLKDNGVERMIEWDYEPEALPVWLTPIKVKVGFLDQEEGDGRNQALFNYILSLQANGMSQAEATETLQIINKYVIKEPLKDKELQVILRDEAFKKPIFYKGDTFLFEKFSEYLIKQFNIKKINGQLHIYKNGIYVEGLNHIEHEMIQIIPHLSRAKRTETLNYIDIVLNESIQNSPAEFIAFKNGIVNIKTGELLSFTPQIVMTNQIPWNYEPKCEKHKLMDTVLNNISVNDKQIRTLIEEMIGYTLYARNELGKCFILVGDGENGKSTLLTLLQTLIGEKNIAGLDLKNLGDRFSTVTLFNKLVNIGDDISSEFVVDTSIFKKIVTGDLIEAEQKGQPKFIFRPFVKLIFSANSIPRLGRGKDIGAIKRRLLIIPLKAKFNKDTKDYKPFIIDELKTKEAMEYLIKLAINGLKRVLENKQFSESEEASKELQAFEEENNPILGFFEECEKLEDEPANEIYKQYTVWCCENNYQSISKGSFIKELKKLNSDLTTVRRRINGKQINVIVRKE